MKENRIPYIREILNLEFSSIYSNITQFRYYLSQSLQNFFERACK